MLVFNTSAGVRLSVKPLEKFGDDFARADEAANILCGLIVFVQRLQRLGLAKWLQGITLADDMTHYTFCEETPDFVMNRIQALFADFAIPAGDDHDITPPVREAYERLVQRLRSRN